MGDLVKRLNADPNDGDKVEAADEIDRLTAENAAYHNRIEVALSMIDNCAGVSSLPEDHLIKMIRQELRGLSDGEK